MRKRRVFNSGGPTQGPNFSNGGASGSTTEHSVQVHGNHSIHVGDPVNLSYTRDPRQAIELELQAYRQQRLQELEAELATANEEIASEIEAMRVQAEANAQEVLRQAELQKEAIEQAAREAGEQQGYHDGYAAGLAEAESETVTALASVQALMEEAYEARRQVLKGFKNQAAGLVGSISQKLLGDLVLAKPEAFLALVETAIENLDLEGQVQVVVSQTAYDAIRTLSNGTEQALGNVTRLKWVLDSSLTHTQVYVLSQTGNYSLGIDDQVKTLVQAFQSHMDLPSFVEPGKPSATVEIEEAPFQSTDP